MQRAERTTGRRPQPLKRWMPGHLAVLKWLLSTRRPRLADGARATGYSVWHVSRILHSPEFRRRYEQCVREELGAVYRARLTDLKSGP